jgi:hypothetical protein
MDRKNRVALTDPWAVRHLTLCVRSLQSASPHARKLLAYLREHGPSANDHIAG